MANTSVEEDKPVQKSAAVKTFNKRAFWLQFGAWALALCVLIASLVYFNFFAPISTDSVAVGDKCPDFTFSTVYESKGSGYGDDKITEISTTEIIEDGNVLVLNFWYTDCAPCVAELPGFNTVLEEFEDVVIVALHKANLERDSVIQNFINTTMNDGAHLWSEYSLIFALDTDDLCLKTLGVTPTYPTTVVVNKEGTVTFMHTNGLPENELRQAVLDAGATPIENS